jgi:hypothetical protein
VSWWQHRYFHNLRLVRRDVWERWEKDSFSGCWECRQACWSCCGFSAFSSNPIYTEEIGLRADRVYVPQESVRLMPTAEHGNPIPSVLSARMAAVRVCYLNQRSYIYSKSSVSLAPKVGP